MLGLVINSLISYLDLKFGPDAVVKVLKEAQLPVSSGYVDTHFYHDADLIAILQASKLRLKISNHEGFMEDLGIFLVENFVVTKYEDILLKSGKSFSDFFLDFPNIVANVEKLFPKPPSSKISMWISQFTKSSFLFHYRTAEPVSVKLLRLGFYSFIIGCFKGLANYYNSNISVTHYPHVDRSLTDLFHVHYVPLSNEHNGEEKYFFVSPNSFQIAALYPFHLAFNRSLTLTQAGIGLQRYLPLNSHGSFRAKASDVFNVTIPRDFDWEFEKLKKIYSQSATMAVTLELPLSSVRNRLSSKAEAHAPNNDEAICTLTLKGRLLYLPEKDWILYLAHPRFKGSTELEALNLLPEDYLADNPARDLMFATTAISNPNPIFVNSNYSQNFGNQSSCKPVSDEKDKPPSPSHSCTENEQYEAGQRVIPSPSSEEKSENAVADEFPDENTSFTQNSGIKDIAEPEEQKHSKDGEKHPKALALRQEDLSHFERSETLLSNTLPPSIVNRLRAGECPILDYHEEVTCLFADIANFTKLSNSKSPETLVQMLSEVFTEFDKVADTLQLEKIKTIGDNYHVAAGVPHPHPRHALAVVEMAIAMNSILHRMNDTWDLGEGVNLSVRVGVNTGPVVAGVIGTKKYLYDLWGEAIDIASIMESSGIQGHVQVSESTYHLLKDVFIFDRRQTLPKSETFGKEVRRYVLIGRYVLDPNGERYRNKDGKPLYTSIFPSKKEWWEYTEETPLPRIFDQRRRAMLLKENMCVEEAIAGIPTAILLQAQRESAIRLSSQATTASKSRRASFASSAHSATVRSPLPSFRSFSPSHGHPTSAQFLSQEGGESEISKDRRALSERAGPSINWERNSSAQNFSSNSRRNSMPNPSRSTPTNTTPSASETAFSHRILNYSAGPVGADSYYLSADGGATATIAEESTTL